MPFLSGKHGVRDAEDDGAAAVLGVPRDLSGHRYLHRAVRARGDLQAYGASGVFAPAVPYAAPVLRRRERCLSVSFREVAPVKANRLHDRLPVAYDAEIPVALHYVHSPKRDGSRRHGNTCQHYT